MKEKTITVNKLNVRCTFTESILGTASGNKDIHEEFIASKAETPSQAKEEVADINVEEEIQKSSSIFAKDETGLHLWDYQIRGFFKESIRASIELGLCDLSVWQYKKAVDNFLFVNPRKIYLQKPDGTIYQKAQENFQRPIRMDTMRGERVALANSELLPAGTYIDFEVELLTGSSKKTKLAILSIDDLKTALDYGKRKGLGQWRSGGHGRFDWMEV
jgi:hypothetical protein